MLRYEFFLSNGSDEPNQIVRENFELWWQGGAYLLFRNKRISNAIVSPPP